MVDLYGPGNGFGWTLGDVIGAQIVSVPMSVALGRAHQSLLAFMLTLIAVFVVTLIVLNVLLHFFIIKPIQEITGLARDVSAGKTDVQEYQVKGKDEIASLGRSFNLMHRSLQNAIRMLEGTT
jgi:protein-histidine pros-kinase